MKRKVFKKLSAWVLVSCLAAVFLTTIASPALSHGRRGRSHYRGHNHYGAHYRSGYVVHGPVVTRARRHYDHYSCGCSYRNGHRYYTNHCRSFRPRSSFGVHVVF
jgi:hypothetical protein